MVSKILILFVSAASFTIANGERIYMPPTIQQRNPPPASFAAAANPNRNFGTTLKPRQGTGQFLPQNLTFVVSVKGLKSNSVDPVVKVSKSGKTGTYETLGKTETLDNNGNPDFLKVFWIIWNKGTQQKLKFEVRDVDNFRRDDPLGQVEVDLDDYVAKGEKLNVKLQNGTGSLLMQKTIPIKFRLYARGLANADLAGHSDPYVEVYWSTGSKGKKILYAKSATIDNTENPDWNQTFEFANYIRGADQWWTFKVYDSDPTGSDDLGEALTEIDPFVATRQTKMLTLGKKGNARLGLTPA